MFTATAVSFQRLANGLFQSEVVYVEDTDQREVLRQTYMVATKPALTQKVKVQLQALKTAVDDSVLDAEIVGEVVGTI